MNVDQQTRARGRQRVHWQRAVLGLKSRLNAVAATSFLGGPQRKLKAKLDARLAYWESPGAPSEAKALESLSSNKLRARPYVKSLGLRSPEIYSDVGDLDAIDFAKLPERVVIKPHNGWDNDGVVVIDGERELMSGAAVPRAELPEFCRNKLASARAVRKPRIIVEEFVQDYDQRFAIPRDFKVFVAGGKAWVIYVVDRNNSQWSFYSRDWVRFSDAFNTIFPPGPLIPQPPRLAELISASELMASDLGAFLRLDFYLTSNGPVFGEITIYPSGGAGFTRFGARYLCDLMDRFPDRIPADLAGRRGG